MASNGIFFLLFGVYSAMAFSPPPRTVYFKPTSVSPQLVVSSSSLFASSVVVQPAWDNHFSAFGAQDVDKILLDYTEDSEVRVYDMRSGAEEVHKGLDGVKNMFIGLFALLSDTSGLDAPLIDVNEGSQGSVFLVWKCPTSGLDLATDTFLFDDQGKIVKQYIVTWPSETGGEATGTCANTDPTGGKIQASWDNHFGAFGAQDVPKILLDYAEDSVVTVFDKKSGERTVFEGLKGVEELFVGLFKDLHDTSELSAPLIQVQEKPGTVWLVWKCPSSGIIDATDCFLFDKNAKIKYQNIVVEKA